MAHWSSAEALQLLGVDCYGLFHHLRYAQEPLEGALLILGYWIIGDGTSPFVKTAGARLDGAVRLRPAVGAETERLGIQVGCFQGFESILEQL